MSVAKKTQDEKKKKKSKPSKEKKSKSGVKSKHEKGQKVKKVESNAVIKNKKKKKKKKSKTSKSKTGESVPKETPSKQIIKEKKVKKLKKDGKKVAKTGGSKKSGSLIVDKTQSSVASTNEKKKEEPKKENMKEKKEEKVEPATPGSAKKIAPIPKKSNLYNIVGEYEDSKSMEKTPNINPKRSPPRKVESPEVKTPETVGPPMADEKEQKAILEKSKRAKRNRKKELDTKRLI
uniref:Uncharacterized protein n=1 Tax=Caenorhabditis tropicalis TaxID=1561998 RepID=A0A1I7TIS8_9PELO